MVHSFQKNGRMEIPEFVMMILERLRRSDHSAYIVGGAVRDACMGRPMADWDVTTSASPGEIQFLFSDTRSFALKHETVTLIHAGRQCEVTSFRGASGKGRGIETDLGHRDFTINAMAYEDGTYQVIDPHGGRRDLSQKVVRAVGNPEDRFKEDPLRLLRAVRIATELGFLIEPMTLGVLIQMAGAISTVSSERVREELMKILLSKKPSRGFHLLRRSGLLAFILPELQEGYRKRQNFHHRYTIYRHIMETLDLVEPNPQLRLTALLHDIAKPRVREKGERGFHFVGHEAAGVHLAKEIMQRLRFSRDMIEEVTGLIGHHMEALKYDSRWSDSAVRRLIRKIGFSRMERFFHFRRADLLAHGTKQRELILLAELKKRVESLSRESLVLKREDLAIDGQRVMECLGLKPGPEVGKLLHILIDRVTECPEMNNEARLLAFLHELRPENENE